MSHLSETDETWFVALARQQAQWRGHQETLGQLQVELTALQEGLFQEAGLDGEVWFQRLAELGAAGASPDEWQRLLDDLDQGAVRLPTSPGWRELIQLRKELDATWNQWLARVRQWASELPLNRRLEGPWLALLNQPCQSAGVPEGLRQIARRLSHWPHFYRPGEAGWVGPDDPASAGENTKVQGWVTGLAKLRMRHYNEAWLALIARRGFWRETPGLLEDFHRQLLPTPAPEAPLPPPPPARRPWWARLFAWIKTGRRSGGASQNERPEPPLPALKILTEVPRNRRLWPLLVHQYRHYQMEIEMLVVSDRAESFRTRDWDRHLTRLEQAYEKAGTGIDTANLTDRSATDQVLNGAREKLGQATELTNQIAHQLAISV